MEIILIAIPFTLYVLFWVLFADHETNTDKDRRKYFEGITLSLSSSYVECFRYFSKVVERYPNSAISHFYLGKCHAHFENYPAAIEAFTKSITFDNTLPETYFEKAKALYYEGKLKESLYEFTKATWHYHDKNREVLLWKGKLEIQTGDIESAKKTLLLAVNLGDEDANFLLQQCNFNSLIRK